MYLAGFIPGEGIVAGQFAQDPDPEAIESPDGPRELVRVPSPLDDERTVDEVDPVFSGDLEPEGIILTCGETFIESAGLMEDGSPDTPEALPGAGWGYRGKA